MSTKRVKRSKRSAWTPNSNACSLKARFLMSVVMRSTKDPFSSSNCLIRSSRVMISVLVEASNSR